LHLAFVAYGPVDAVKVMWPRTVEEFARDHNSGFVSFAHRQDAEAAFQAMHQTKVCGRTVRIAWGRPVRRSEQPLSNPPGLRIRGGQQQPFALDAAASRGNTALPRIVVQPPIDLQRRRDIDQLARDFVANIAEGSKVSGQRTDESAGVVLARNEVDADGSLPFRFLGNASECNSDDGVYYRWRVHSLLNGDTETRWRTAPFATEEGGPLWNPPSCSRPINNPMRLAASPGQDSNPEELEIEVGARFDNNEDEERDKEGLANIPKLYEDACADAEVRCAANSLDNGIAGENEILSTVALRSLEASVTRLDLQLHAADADELTALLADTTTRRSSIGRAMVFCIDQARCAGDVSCRILLPLARGSSVSPLALLLLTHDVLCNVECGRGGAAAFRQRLEVLLPTAMCGLGRWLCTSGAGGLISATRARVTVNTVLQSWEERGVFQRDFVELLRAQVPTINISTD
jgi:RNA recognition motif. (a.k.a. RRM, RBD, or RNP domain)